MCMLCHPLITHGHVYVSSHTTPHRNVVLYSEYCMLSSRKRKKSRILLFGHFENPFKLVLLSLDLHASLRKDHYGHDQHINGHQHNQPPLRFRPW